MTPPGALISAQWDCGTVWCVSCTHRLYKELHQQSAHYTFSRLLMNNVQLLSTISENFNNGQNFSTNSQNLSTYVQNFWTLFTFRHWAKLFNNHIKLFDNDSLFDIEQNCSTINFNVSTIMKNFRQCSETFQQSFWFNQTAKLLNINFGFSTFGQIN